MSTVVAPRRAVRFGVGIGFPLVGGVIGWFLKPLVAWALSLPWIPFEGPMKLIDSIPEPWGRIGGAVLGIAAGLVIVALAEADYPHIEVTDSRATFGKGDDARTVPRDEVLDVFLDGKALIVIGPGTREAVRYSSDISGMEKRVAGAFTAHGWPWRDSDPYADEYRRWVPDTPDLSGAVNALFQARERALERGDEEDAEQLRGELARLDVVIRDGQRQSWRPSG